MPIEEKATKPIGYEKAAIYLSNLIKSESSFGFINYSGGTFNLRKFKDWDGQGIVFSGIMCWFCKDDRSNIFIAIEPRFNFEYDENSLHKVKPESEYLFIPPQLLDKSILAGSNLQEGELERRLRGFRKPMVKPNKKAKNRDVVSWVNNFRSDSNFKELSSYGFTYFINNGKTKEGSERSFISEFLIQNQIQFVRYFFGLDTDLKTDKLRLILVPVDFSGKNIEPAGNRLDDESLLQYSWPPST
ncbi:hypothetical protein [Algoriphagus sp.]|uniref:hypothetical protein n=1 Tax=Algoriphagus sp. TaxID=1872435 RepID=UPI002730012D|nr:hypothetical protein [Algoriphagus sp.]MDP2042742.1 hypothetical protein [Algoriphagus sp.]